MPRLRLQYWLKRRKLSKRKFAKLLGVTYSAVFHYFRKGYNPTLDMLARWASVLDCKVRDLIEE